MCGIAAALQLSSQPAERLEISLGVMNKLQQHRGPDGEGLWSHPRGHVGLGHRRLSVIDLVTGDQPMGDKGGNWVSYNGEIYNYRELRNELGAENFTTTSDTEVILHAYRKWGPDCVSHFTGMFAFALWDEQSQTLFCARDRFGIKPFYYVVVDDLLYCASEAKALLPFLPQIRTDIEGLKDYLAFQFCLAGKTLFQDIHELQPGHSLTVRNGQLAVNRYWQVYYDLDWQHTGDYFQEQIYRLLEDSVRLHLRADVPVGSYISGGFDSGAVTAMAARMVSDPLMGFTGKFPLGPEYDESPYARQLAEQYAISLDETAITADDFLKNIRRVIYHLDYPVAGPGSFPQFMVSRSASQHRKVVLGGQGGDEIFGGYARYLIAYFEQCIKAAIDGTMHNGNFVVTYESIIPSLSTLRQYKPLLQQFWREGLFEDLDRRYYHLINRTPVLENEIRWELLGDYSSFETFKNIFHGENVEKESYFDLMTHFDFKTLLPALLHVEDRVSMAHGLESRVPLLDHPLVELSATIPANIKFQNGHLKHIFREATRSLLPDGIVNRNDKMGFPVPLSEWMQDEAGEFVRDVLTSRAAKGRDFVNNELVASQIDNEPRFGRKIWGLLSLELWQQEFHDKESQFKGLLQDAVV